MESGKTDVFISYRRDGGSAEARLIRSALGERGLNTFLDVTSLTHGMFDETLLTRIAEARIFLLVLSPHALDRCVEEQDWLRREIAHALQTGRVIVPVMLPGFEFPDELPAEIKALPRHQAVPYSHTLFDATVSKLLDAIGAAGGRALKPRIAYYRVSDYVWNRLGARGLLPLALLIALPILLYSAFNFAVNSTIPRLVGDFGVNLEAADWSLHPFSLTAVAHDVTVRPANDRRAAPVFAADQVEFGGTLGTVVAGLAKDLLSLVTLGWADSGQPFNVIRITRGELHFELSTTGHLNWTDFWDAVPRSRKEQLKTGRFPIDAAYIDHLKISYVEDIPERSGGGITRTSQAHIDLDEVSGSIVDLQQSGSGDRRSAFKFNARSAGGIVTISGNAGLSSEPSGSTRPEPTVPYFPYVPAKFDVALDNIGAGAFAKVIPDATGIVATSGTLRGSINVTADRDRYDCVSNVEMADVKLAPNPRVVVVKTEFDRALRDLANWQTSGRFDACKPFEQAPADRPTSSRASLLVAAFNAQAATNAPPSVRAIVLRDQRSLTGETVADAVAHDVLDKLGQEAGQRATRMLGARSGSLIQGAIGSQPSGASNAGEPRGSTIDGDNALAKGAKSAGHTIGRGFKKLFGRGQDPNKKKP
jgi:hypothetical protein